MFQLFNFLFTCSYFTQKRRGFQLVRSIRENLVKCFVKTVSYVSRICLNILVCYLLFLLYNSRRRLENLLPICFLQVFICVSCLSIHFGHRLVDGSVEAMCILDLISEASRSIYVYRSICSEYVRVLGCLFDQLVTVYDEGGMVLFNYNLILRLFYFCLSCWLCANFYWSFIIN